MFQLTAQEIESLRFQIGTSKIGRGGRRYLPYAFTQEGVAMVRRGTNQTNSQQKLTGRYTRMLWAGNLGISWY